VQWWGAPRDDPLGQRPASGSATAARPVAQACQWAALALVNGVVISELEGLLWTAAHPLPAISVSWAAGHRVHPAQSWRPRRASWPTKHRRARDRSGAADVRNLRVHLSSPCGETLVGLVGKHPAEVQLWLVHFVRASSDLDRADINLRDTRVTNGANRTAPHHSGYAGPASAPQHMAHGSPVEYSVDRFQP
jgi:hypothetical protein